MNGMCTPVQKSEGRGPCGRYMYNGRIHFQQKYSARAAQAHGTHEHSFDEYSYGYQALKGAEEYQEFRTECSTRK